MLQIVITNALTPLSLIHQVDHSELPWRMLSREYGCHAAYTPMFHGLQFATQKKYRQKNFSTCPEDRPLFVQFCANDADLLLAAARHVESDCDGVDINLGCPQDIARRGRYGAFLQDEWKLIEEMVTKLRNNLTNDIAVSCKIRKFDQLERTIQYGQMLERAGCTFIGLHGRTREQRGTKTGMADWNCIRAVKDRVSIPVIANGNIQSLNDAEECLKFTGADAIMTAEGNLYNPALFQNIHQPAWIPARKYLDYVGKYPIPAGMAKSHLFKLFHRCMAVDDNAELRSRLGRSTTLEQQYAVIDCFEQKYNPNNCDDLSMPISVLPVPPYLCQARYRYGLEQTRDGSVVASCRLASGVATDPDGAQKRIKLDVT